MTAPDLSHIRGIIWDLDGTLYRYDAVFILACNIAAAHTALDLGLQMNVDEAIAMAKRSYAETGSSFQCFMQYGYKYEDFHLPYHKRVDATIILKNLEMKTALEALNIPMVILTNASRDWARKTLDHLDCGHIFGDANLLSLEDVDYHTKAQSRKGFEKSLSILDVHPDETLMVEDLPKNLLHAKNMGMTTALVHHGKPPERGLSHIDHIFDDTLELVRLLRKSRV